MKNVISYTVNFQRERITIRYENNTEEVIGYNNLYKKNLAKANVSVSKKEVSDFLKEQQKRIKNIPDITPARSEKLLGKTKGEAAEKNAAVYLKNEKAVEVAQDISKTELAQVLKKMRVAINGDN